MCQLQHIELHSWREFTEYLSPFPAFPADSLKLTPRGSWTGAKKKNMQKKLRICLLDSYSYKITLRLYTTCLKIFHHFSALLKENQPSFLKTCDTDDHLFIPSILLNKYMHTVVELKMVKGLRVCCRNLVFFQRSLVQTLYYFFLVLLIFIVHGATF